MAFLVCYSKSASEDGGGDTAIYLDQEFYGIIFQTCISERSRYANLSAVASLRYKSPTLVIAGKSLDLLAEELVTFERSGNVHPQIAELRQVCLKAKADGCGLSISGDMYPEL